MADNLNISTGSGTTIATDQIGTAHYQKIKLMVGAADTADYLVFGQGAMASSVPVVIANDQSTLNVSVVAFTPGGTQNVSMVKPIYSVGGTDMGATGTGMMILGVQSGATTGRAIALTVSGQPMVNITNTPTVTVSTALSLAVTTGTVNVVNTPTVTVSTALALAVTTGTINVVNTPTVTVSTALGLAITTGTVNVVAMPVISASGVTIASIAAGTVDKLVLCDTVSTVSTVLAMPVLSASGVTIASIAAGTLDKLVLCDTVSTVSTVLAMPVLSASGVTIASITTGSVSVINTPTITVSNNPLICTASGVTIAAITTGTVSVVNTPTITVSNNPLICTASGVTIAAITTGTVSVVGAPVVTASISNASLAIIETKHASAWNAYAVATTAAATILKTSGAHTLYVTDLLFSVDVPMNIVVNDGTAAISTVYLATKGGFVFPTRTPIILTSAKSLTFTPSASGSCAGYAAGITVT